MSKNTLNIFLTMILLCFVLSLMFHSKESIYTDSKLAKNKIIVLDPGHGYPDSGTSSADGICEKDLNLQIALLTKKILESKGFDVVLTRKNDLSLSKSKTNNKREDLINRKKIREQANADIFISIHMNHFSEEKYYGAQVFYNDITEENEYLAKTIQENLIEIADPSNTRVHKKDNSIFVLKNTNIPSVLVECGFLSNSEEAMRLSDKNYQTKIAKAIYFGIKQYLKSSEKNVKVN